MHLPRSPPYRPKNLWEEQNEDAHSRRAANAILRPTNPAVSPKTTTRNTTAGWLLTPPGGSPDMRRERAGALAGSRLPPRRHSMRFPPSLKLHVRNSDFSSSNAHGAPSGRAGGHYFFSSRNTVECHGSALLKFFTRIENGSEAHRGNRRRFLLL